MYRRGNLCIIIGDVCTKIYRPLSYPFISLICLYLDEMSDYDYTIYDGLADKDFSTTPSPQLETLRNRFPPRVNMAAVQQVHRYIDR